MRSATTVSLAFSLLLASAAWADEDGGSNPKLRSELLQMAEVDQEARQALRDPNRDRKASGERIADVDRKNTARMKEIIREHGWPGEKLVGKRGAFSAWLLVQHADLDPEFQKSCLPLMEKAVKAGEASAKDWAYLVDRVLVAEGKPQRYGTQFWQQEGKMVPRPLEAPEQVDQRRASVGLSTMAEYEAQMKRMMSGK